MDLFLERLGTSTDTRYETAEGLAQSNERKDLCLIGLFIQSLDSSCSRVCSFYSTGLDNMPNRTDPLGEKQKLLYFKCYDAVFWQCWDLSQVYHMLFDGFLRAEKSFKYTRRKLHSMDASITYTARWTAADLLRNPNDISLNWKRSYELVNLVCWQLDSPVSNLIIAVASSKPRLSMRYFEA